MAFNQLHTIGIGLFALGFLILPINYFAQVENHRNTEEVSYRLDALKTRIVKLEKYSLERNDVELVVREIEAASERLAEIQQSNNSPASFKNLSFMFYSGLTITGGVLIIVAPWRRRTKLPQELDDL